MATEHGNRRELLGRMLSAAHNKGFSVAGNPDLGWILIRQAKLGHDFNRAESSVSIRFTQNTGKPDIAVFASVELRSDSKACPHLLQPTGPASRWRPLCPYIFHDVGDDILELIASLVGLLAQPCLCGLLGCEAREGIWFSLRTSQTGGNYPSFQASDMPVVE